MLIISQMVLEAMKLHQYYVITEDGLEAYFIVGCTGFLVMLCNKAIAKQMMLTLLPAFYALYPVPLRRLWQPPIHTLQVCIRSTPLQGTLVGIYWLAVVLRWGAINMKIRH